MSRRSTIPLPGLPAVSHVEGPARMDPSVASAPERAATDMLVTGLRGAAHVISERNKAKEGAAWNEYQSQRNIYAMKQRAADQAALSTFNQASKTASPEEIDKLRDDMLTLRQGERNLDFEKLKTWRQGLSKERQQQANLDLNELSEAALLDHEAAKQHAFEVRQDRTFSIEIARTKQNYENIYGDPGSEEEIEALEGILRKHFGSEDEFNTMIDDLRSTSTTKNLVGKISKAQTPDEKALLEKEYASVRGILDGGREQQIENEFRGFDRKLLRVTTEFEVNANNGNLDHVALEMSHEIGQISDEQHEHYKQLDATADQRKSEKLLFDIWEDKIWDEKGYEELEALMGDTIKTHDFAKVDKLVDKYARTETERAFIQKEALALLTLGTLEENKLSFSNHMGDLIDDLDISDAKKQEARNAYNRGVSDLIGTINNSGSFISVSRPATVLEEKIANLYDTGTVTDDSIKGAYKAAEDAAASKIVTKSIKKGFLERLGGLGKPQHLGPSGKEKGKTIKPRTREQVEAMPEAQQIKELLDANKISREEAIKRLERLKRGE